MFALFPQRPPRRTELLACVVINQFVTPGLGSLFARRVMVGCGQLLVACVGFLLFLGWFVQKMRLLYGQIYGTDLSEDAGNALGKWGVILFAAAWLWSLVTSLQILRALPKDSLPLLPPKIH